MPPSASAHGPASSVLPAPSIPADGAEPVTKRKPGRPRGSKKGAKTGSGLERPSTNPPSVEAGEDGAVVKRKPGPGRPRGSRGRGRGQGEKEDGRTVAAALARERGTGLFKPQHLSPFLSGLLGGLQNASRPVVIKSLWNYIRSQGLKDPKDGRYVLCDENLLRLFANIRRISSFKMNAMIGRHLMNADDPKITDPAAWEEKLNAPVDLTDINDVDPDNVGEVADDQLGSPTDTEPRTNGNPPSGTEPTGRIKKRPIGRPRKSLTDANATDKKLSRKERKRLALIGGGVGKRGPGKKKRFDEHGNEIKRKSTGFSVPLKLSKVLGEFFGGAEAMSRTDVIKGLWDYIRSNNLQDPVDKRVIHCDTNLKRILGPSDTMTMFQMNKILSMHIGSGTKDAPMEGANSNTLNIMPAVVSGQSTGGQLGTLSTTNDLIMSATAVSSQGSAPQSAALGRGDYPIHNISSMPPQM